MNFKINKKTLLNSLFNVSIALSTKTPSPLFTGILIEVKNDKLTLITSNKEISAKEEIFFSSELGVVYEEGKVLVPGLLLVEIVKKIEDEEIEFNLFDSTSVKISTSSSQFSLNILDVENYPFFDFNEKGFEIELPVKKIKKIIKQTTFASSNSKDRVVLTGVNFELSPENFRAVATDSYRLSEYKSTSPNTDVKKHLNIPATALNDINKILVDDEGKVVLRIGENKVIFLYKTTTIIARVIEGAFPDTISFFNRESLFEAVFTKQSLVSAIERINLLSVDDFKLIKMVFNTSGEIKLFSTDSEVGNGQETLKPNYISDCINFSISFSSKYILDALKAIEGNEIRIKFIGEIKPFIITCDQDAEISELVLAARAF